MTRASGAVLAVPAPAPQGPKPRGLIASRSELRRAARRTLGRRADPLRARRGGREENVDEDDGGSDADRGGAVPPGEQDTGTGGTGDGRDDHQREDSGRTRGARGAVRQGRRRREGKGSRAS